MTAHNLEIVEIIGPSEQGQQTPYKCRAEDGEIYYVKGRQTNRSSLWHEWICAHLARSFGLMVPPFSLVNVSQALLDEAQQSWRDLGTGIAFGSQNHATAAWVEPSMADKVPVQVQRDVLMFDWWVHNSDRLTHNSNLLWDTSNKHLVVIDHNMAFDANFTTTSFFSHHIFSDQWSAITSDLVMQTELSQRLSEAFTASFTLACDNAPPEWNWENTELDIPARVDLSAIRDFLLRCDTPELWRTV
jgi:hypothetical protein